MGLQIGGGLFLKTSEVDPFFGGGWVQLSSGMTLALFIRRGMLAWIELCHRCIPVPPNQEKRMEQPAFANETTSEMIKVMANITLFNLEEALL